jgi:HlyD family secretion protein
MDSYQVVKAPSGLSVAIKSAQAEVERIESILHDLILVSPRTGRVQYQLARNGEVVAAGRKVFTILDLQDVYMTVLLPANVAGRVEMGGEARIILDPVPEYVIIAADAQFTPKTVETADEREKLMFRAKLQVDAQVLKEYSQRVKTGVRSDLCAPIPRRLGRKTCKSSCRRNDRRGSPPRFDCI